MRPSNEPPTIAINEPTVRARTENLRAMLADKKLSAQTRFIQTMAISELS